MRTTAVRRRLLLGSLPVLVLLVLFAGKAISMVAVNESGRDAYADEPAAAAEHFDRIHTLNLFQRWIAPFNSGTARSAAGDLDPARADLMLALDLAPESRQCVVAVNLALTLEALGDQAAEQDRAEDARAFWTQAIDVLAEHACDIDPQAGEESTETRTRIEQKLEESQGGDGGDDGESEDEPEQDPDEPQDTEQKEREVERRNREAQEDKQNDRDFDRRDDQPDVDRPW